jgi:hypothetical protein
MPSRFGTLLLVWISGLTVPHFYRLPFLELPSAVLVPLGGWLVKLIILRKSTSVEPIWKLVTTFLQSCLTVRLSTCPTWQESGHLC